MATPAFPYDGPAELRRPVIEALMRVVDPEVALSVVDVGLVYGVVIGEGRAHVRLTMTSAACPVADVIVDDVDDALSRVLPADLPVDVEVVWEPPWTPAMMSERARRFMDG